MYVHVNIYAGMADELGGQPVVVIDTGSSTTKAGLSNEDSPKVVFPSVIGRPRHKVGRQQCAIRCAQ